MWAHSNRNPADYPTPSRLNVWAAPRSRIQHCLSNRSVFMPEHTHWQGRLSIIGLRGGVIYISTIPLFSDGGSDWASENYAVFSDCAAGIHCNTALHLPTRHCYARWIFIVGVGSVQKRFKIVFRCALSPCIAVLCRKAKARPLRPVQRSCPKTENLFRGSAISSQWAKPDTWMLHGKDLCSTQWPHPYR